MARHGILGICYAFLAALLVESKPTPSAISIPFSPKWHGYDGSWSAASVHVGTPPQPVDLYVSTASSETLVIGPGGCDGTPRCFYERGGVFDYIASSSWDSQGAFYLGLDPQLNFAGKGNYGLDNIAFGNNVSVPSQVVGAINSTDYWLGFFGLGVRATNLKDQDRLPLLSSAVENQSLILSHSYGFTAGAHYRLRGVPGSLTLGGVDTNRFRQDHNVSFILDSNRRPVVAITQITAKAAPLDTSDVAIGWPGNSNDLMLPEQADLFNIDSSTPFLWFPEPVCLQFERALNLTYDNELRLYTYGNDTNQRDRLRNWNITFEFTLANVPDGTRIIKLTLPYDAFDLHLSYPFPGLNVSQNAPAVNYFPLRKAINSSTQYTIGRSFLQETYLTVDYERNNFSVYPANFVVDPTNNMHLVDIRRPENSMWKGPGPDLSGGLSKGGIVGVTIAAILAFCIFTGLLYIIFRVRQRHAKKGYVKEEEYLSQHPSNSTARLLDWLFHRPSGVRSTQNTEQVPELHGRETSSAVDEPGAQSRGEQAAIRSYHEPIQDHLGVPSIPVNAIGHDPSMPVELPYRSSDYHPSRKLEVVQELAPSPDNALCSELQSSNEKDHRMSHRQYPTDLQRTSSPSSNQHSARDSRMMQLVSPITPDRDDVSSQDTIARRAAWYVSNQTPSVSSESQVDSPKSYRGAMSIDRRAGFSTRHSRHNTVSSMDYAIIAGAPSASNTISTSNSPSSYTKVPRNSRATARLAHWDSTTSGETSETSSVKNVIRKSVQRGFSWLHPHTEEGTGTRRTEPTSATSDISPYSPARWIEFWKTGRDPRLGPTSNNETSRGGQTDELPPP